VKFGKSKLSPSYTRKPSFKSHESKETHFEFGCINCEAPIVVEFNLLTNRVSRWEQEVGEDFAAEAKEFYKIGVVGKSQDGGWPSMIRVQCPYCKTTHLVYAGVDEVSNSVYFVTLQGIVEIKEDDKSAGNEVFASKRCLTKPCS
jgi:hypothetical protein